MVHRQGHERVEVALQTQRLSYLREIGVAKEGGRSERNMIALHKQGEKSGERMLVHPSITSITPTVFETISSNGLGI